MWQQSQVTGDSGGIKLAFTNGAPDSTGLADQNGVAMDQSDTNNNNGGFTYRRVDLTSEAGRAISNLQLNVNSTTPAGNWQFFYFDMALVSKDGTVHPIYTGEPGVSLSGSGTSGVTNVSNQMSYYGSGPSTGSYPAAIFPGSTTNYYHADHLGSARLMTSFNGYPVWSATFLPFGQEWNPQLTTNHYKFTGKERDSESGLDHFDFRKYNSSLGRWMSPDPVGIFVASVSTPQSWNLYSYTLNNPLKYTDPTGLYCYYGDTSAGSSDWGDNSQYDFHSSQGECTTPDENGNSGTWFDDPSTTVTVNGDTGDVDTTSVSTGNIGSTPVTTTQTFHDTNAVDRTRWILRRIGRYIPVVCGAGVFNYGGLRLSGDVASVGLYQIRGADTRSGYSEGPFTDITIGEGVQAGYGYATYPGGENEHFLFGGVGGDVGVVAAGVSLYGSHVSGDSWRRNQFGINGDAGFLVFGAGVGAGVNTDSLTSCVDHNFH